jgi:hypothetical protein
MGQMEMKCIFNIGKNISILAKVTQVSDVVHGPLVFWFWFFFCFYFFCFCFLFLFGSNDVLNYI